MTDYERQQIKRLWCAKVPIKEIVRMLPCTERKARAYINEMRESGELKAEDRKRDLKKVLTEMFDSGMTVEEVCSELKIDTVTLYCYCSIHKVAIKRSKKYKKRIQPKVEDLCEKTQKIVADLQSGLSNIEVARLNGVSRQHVSKIKKNYLEVDK